MYEYIKSFFIKESGEEGAEFVEYAMIIALVVVLLTAMANLNKTAEQGIENTQGVLENAMAGAGAGG